MVTYECGASHENRQALKGRRQLSLLAAISIAPSGARSICWLFRWFRFAAPPAILRHAFGVHSFQSGSGAAHLIWLKQILHLQRGTPRFKTQVRPQEGRIRPGTNIGMHWKLYFPLLQRATPKPYPHFAKLGHYQRKRRVDMPVAYPILTSPRPENSLARPI